MKATSVKLARPEIGVGLYLILASLFLLVLASCAAKPAITDLMLPINSVRATVAAQMPFGVRKESTNGREFTSGYFTTTSLDEDGTERSAREFAQVTILGPGRPYSIDVKVTREQKIKNTNRYRTVGLDKKLADELAKRIKEALAQRREDRNVIDDFRAF
jgi:hypothetical protein